MTIFSTQQPPTLISNEQLGGKAANLFRLSAAGFRVPPFIVISSDVFREEIGRDSTIAELVGELFGPKPDSVDATRLNQCINTIQAKIVGCELSSTLITAIERAYTQRFPAKSFVAVRSSANDEDGSQHSFAGMHDSFMFVPDLAGVLHSVKQVWASAFNARAIAYRVENGLDLTKISVAVIIQQMIDAKTSGVIFTCNPANNRTDEIVLSSVWGAGEGLVSGGLAADTFVVKKKDGTTVSTVVEKEHQLRFDRQRNSGLEALDVADEKQNVSSLSELEIVHISKIAIEIENHYRRPQDIEFCLDDNGDLYILQARPITRLAEYGPAAGNRLTWDNSNIIESYSGVTTPMTFSFIRRAYTIVYHCFAEVMGIPPQQVHDSRHVFENMLGMIRGRVFYNLQNWYRLIRLFPGFQYNAHFMESMMGIKEPLELADAPPRPSWFQKYFVELPALLRLVSRTLGNFRRIRPIVRRFESDFQACYSRWDAMDFSRLPPHELKSLYHEMEDALLWNWKAPIINDFYVMIYYGLLKKLCAKWAHDETGALQNDLICGEGGVESAEPAKMLLRLAADAAKIPELKALIFEDPLEELPAKVGREIRYAQFHARMQLYLQRYGFRCMNELKLEEYSLRDRPHVVYQVLRNYLSLADSSALDVDAMQVREQQVRRSAEQTAFAAIGSQWSLLPRQTIFRRVLRNARTGVKNRENMRFARTRIYGVVRELIRAIGQQLADEKIITHREDIFYLTIDEVWDFIKGTAVTAQLDQLAELRRCEFEGYRESPAPDDRFDTYGFVYHQNRFVNPDDKLVELADGQLCGTGCCPGVITNKVRVLKSPQDNLALSGEILVAERTDPGWVPLYPAVSGILIERGSVLSHSAVVAREMGIPTIVGIKGLLMHIHDGDTVTMDGASGVVTLNVQHSADGSDEPNLT